MVKANPNLIKYKRLVLQRLCKKKDVLNIAPIGIYREKICLRDNRIFINYFLISVA